MKDKNLIKKIKNIIRILREAKKSKSEEVKTLAIESVIEELEDICA